MLKIAIVDDDEIICEEITKRINAMSFFDNIDYQIRCYFDGDHFMTEENNITYDIILLDIDMPKTDGLKVASSLRSNDISSIIIYITSKIMYMKDAFGLNVFGFIDKSELAECLEPMLHKCLNYIEQNIAISFRSNEGLLKVFKKDIILAEYINRKITIYTCKGAYIINLPSLPQFLKTVNSSCFIYINRNTVININHLINTIDNHAHLKNHPYPIPISIERVKDVNNALIEWVSAQGII